MRNPGPKEGRPPILLSLINDIYKCRHSLTFLKIRLAYLSISADMVECHCTLTLPATMYVRTPLDLGALIRDRRKKLGLDQALLAEKAGTSRQWIVAVERGKPRAEIGLLLRTLAALGLSLAAVENVSLVRKGPRKAGHDEPVDINQIISSLQTPRQ